MLLQASAKIKPILSAAWEKNGAENITEGKGRKKKKQGKERKKEKRET
ncbi:hypothetical protein L345_16392 [Ophiophagus hannah]|uniref:Uncharacterized protein n=1 Tax=Ophiophagus hannah TaxID=8665 RepID=V8N703_OPHHA|nr:hypothetical protein L345_16392 [Ophiophagus hannah]